MFITEENLYTMNRIKRLNIINSITGIKPANLIGTVSKSGQVNLAIFSSIVHLGSNPAYIGFVLRPQGEVPRHTYENIKETGVYTINHIHEDFVAQAHYTSVKFDRGVSEFEACKFSEEYIHDFDAPFVLESSLKIGMEFVEEIPIAVNNTSMIVGKVKNIFIPDNCINDKGYINLATNGQVGIGGLNSYYSLEKIAEFPYAREKELPKF